MNKMENTEMEAKRGRPFTDFEDLITLQKINCIDLALPSYNHRDAFNGFINSRLFIQCRNCRKL